MPNMALMVYPSAKAFSLPPPVESRFRELVIRNAASNMAENVPIRPGSSSKLKEFPHLSASHRALMTDLVGAAESRLEDHLLPCTLPPDVEYFQNQNGTSQGALLIRSGSPDSSINFILGSWLHSQLPTGASLNIASLSAYLRPSTDAPNFLIEFIQSSPTSLILILDLPPRKDLVLNPDYLQLFYEDTGLDKYRKAIEELPEVRPYAMSSLFFRSLVSPTSIIVRVDTESGGPERMEEIIANHVGPVARDVIRVWLDECACKERGVGEMERGNIEKRDELVKKKTIDIDLGSSLPRLFGQEIADRVVAAIQQIFEA
ncbi:red chlorophyll catabolite reductase-like [Cucurbita pepo subsp. pepo]|uniref:red chlorophyll catabolite reductase-like n=1 Tax=Cucurbita pepo subsp. pepo TaxID=3664 RepID=UPI000C9D9292|nr:red chlorophyll catabolite reductase-like [Cucurbita pepo subsp. pepo]